MTQGMLHSVLSSPGLYEDAPLQYRTPENAIQYLFDSPNHIEVGSIDAETPNDLPDSNLHGLITSLERASKEALLITSNPALSEKISAALQFAKYLK